MTGTGGILSEAPLQEPCIESEDRPKHPWPGFFETIYGMTVHPFATLSELAKGRPMTGWAFAVFVLSASTQVASLAALIAEASGMTHGESAPLVGGIYLLLIAPLWIVRAALFNLISGYLDGSGKGPLLLSLIGFCQVPGMLWGIAIGIPAVAGSSVGSLIPLAGIIWTSVLEVAAIREAQGVSTAKAVLVFLIPLLALVVAFVAYVVISVSALSRMTGVFF